MAEANKKTPLNKFCFLTPKHIKRIGKKLEQLKNDGRKKTFKNVHFAMSHHCLHKPSGKFIDYKKSITRCCKQPGSEKETLKETMNRINFCLLFNRFRMIRSADEILVIQADNAAPNRTQLLKEDPVSEQRLIGDVGVLRSAIVPSMYIM